MKKLNTVELFAGTESFSKVMRKHGHNTWTTDNDPQFKSDMRANVMDLFDDLHGIMPWDGKIDILWASPPCQGFSVAVIGRNWNHDGTPKTDSARLSMKLAKKTLRVIAATKPVYWFIENPRGMLRKMPWMEKFLKEHGGVRREISYCHYGEKRMKPTDIWTNAVHWTPRPICHNQNPGHPQECCCRDHDAAPRGVTIPGTGTQGMKSARERSEIPPPFIRRNSRTAIWDFSKAIAQMRTWAATKTMNNFTNISFLGTADDGMFVVWKPEDWHLLRDFVASNGYNFSDSPLAYFKNISFV